MVVVVVGGGAGGREGRGETGMNPDGAAESPSFDSNTVLLCSLNAPVVSSFRYTAVNL